DKALLRNALSKAVRARDRPVLASSIAGPPMGLWRLLARIVHGKGRGVEELARCLEMPAGELRASQPNYCEFEIPKRSGGTRRIVAPDDATKALQRRILRRLLGRLRSHPAAHGFEQGRSIVTNAEAHVSQAVVVRMDLKDFFTATRTKRVRKYFRRIGWNRPAARLLTNPCTFEGIVPH